MKVRLTEQQFKEYIKYLIESSIVCEGSREKVKSVTDFQNKLGTRISDTLRGNPELQAQAQTMGINPEYSDKGRAAMRNKDYQGINLNAKLKDKLKKAARILNRYTSDNPNSRGTFNFKQLNVDYPNEYNELIHIKEFLDSKGLTWLYDVSVTPDNELTASGRHIFGLNRDDTTVDQRIDNFDLSTIGQIKDWNDKGAKSDEEAIVKMKANFLDAYMDKVYGLRAELPKTVFANGNEKLPDDTLIINFAAAMQCPAWNECLLRNACYARKGEKQHSNVRDANVQRNLMWEAGHQDPELLQMIFQLMRLYCVDYDRAVKQIKSKLGENYTVETLSEKNFSELSEDIINILKANNKIAHIRLNENGDFIGDWLVHAFDKAAGDFKKIGILTSAYTCRNLRGADGKSIYDNVANIILNVSNAAIKSDNVTRYFFAIDPELYEAFDETYGGPNGNLVVEENGVTPIPQPLYNFDRNGNIVETDTLYYKCPCERKTANGKKVNCYDCNVCYEPNTVSDKPYYVLVQIHSNGAKNAQGIHVKNNIPKFGFSKNFLSNLNNKGISVDTDAEYRPAMNENKEMLRESFINSFKTGILTIAKYCVNSIKEHLNSLAQE